jgi:transcriptional regulator with XRE-family HTH domain
VPRTRKRYISPVDEKAIGKHLRELREKQGLTQTQIAEQLNIKQTLVSAYERGAVRLHAALLAAFARALKASADEVLGLEKAKGEPLTHDKRLARLVREIDALSRREREALLKTISNYLKGSRVA